MAENRRVEIHFDKAVIREPLAWTVTQRLNALPDAWARFAFSEAESSKPDYAASVVILQVAGSSREPLFTGVTDEVDAKDGMLKVAFHTDPGLAESQIRGWGFLNVPHQEMFWSTVREAGYNEEQVNTEGWSPGPWEIFEVAVPVLGVSLSGHRVLGNIRLTADVAMRDLAAGFNDLDIANEFVRGPVWALTTVTARTLFDAEKAGLDRIEIALGWVMARARYSYFQLPFERPRSWRRLWGEANPDRGDVVAVRGLSTGRRWLHAPKLLTAERTLELVEFSDLLRPGLPVSLTLQERLAITSWRRARLTTDPILAVGALWEALEFYAFDIELPPLFSKEEEATAIETAIAGRTEPQAKRIRARLLNLNQTPLPEALTRVFDVDSVPIAAAELSLLRKLRQQRNDFVHGRGGSPPDLADLRYGLAIVARMLVYRVHRRDREIFSTHSNPRPAD